MKFASAWLGALLALGACSTDSSSDKVAGGGFETSDLSAVLVDSSGNPVVGARVWILSPGSDTTASSSVVDSTTSDSLGVVRFSVKGANQSVRYGLEAWLGDTLSGIRTAIDLSTSATVPLRMDRTKALTLPCSESDSSIFVMHESHFRQSPPSNCQDSFRILVPPGDWNVFSIPSDGAPPRKVYRTDDSLPPWRPPPDSGTPPWLFGPRPPPPPPDSGKT